MAGTDVTEYKYKIREAADTACSNSAGYSSATAVASHITNSISGKADGTIEVCVIGKDNTGNWQAEASASTVSWTKDTAAPTATLTNAPTGTNSTVTLNVTVAGTDVTQYKYKVREGATTACSNSAGYSSVVAIATLSPIASRAFPTERSKSASSVKTQLATGKRKPRQRRPAGRKTPQLLRQRSAANLRASITRRS